MIEEELRALILFSSLPPSWETFVKTIFNASSTAMTTLLRPAPFFPKMAGASHLSRTPQEMPIRFKIPMIGTTAAEAPPDYRAPQEVGASPVASISATTTRSPDTSRLIVRHSRLRMRRIREPDNRSVQRK